LVLAMGKKKNLGRPTGGVISKSCKKGGEGGQGTPFGVRDGSVGKKKSIFTVFEGEKKVC